MSESLDGHAYMLQMADEITKLRAELAAANALAEQRLRGWVDEGKEKDALRTDLAAETERARKLEADGLAKFERIYLLEADLAAASDQSVDNVCAYLDSINHTNTANLVRKKFDRINAALKGDGDD